MRTIEQVRQDIKDVENRIMCQEIGNDLYYTSPQYDEDHEQLQALQDELKELQENHEVYNG